MRRAHFRYERDSWESLLEEFGFTVLEVAKAADVTERHIYDVLGQVTVEVRHRTKKKMEDGLARLGVPKDRIAELFTK